MPFLTANATVPASVPARGRMLRLVLGSLAVAELLAFWLVCSHQVRMAEARRDEAAVQQTALADCLQFIPGSTIASCTARGGASTLAPAAPANGAVPVSFNLR